MSVTCVDHLSISMSMCVKTILMIMDENGEKININMHLFIPLNVFFFQCESHTVQQWRPRAYLCLRCRLQVAQPVAKSLGSQAELAILLLDAGHALEHHFIILSRKKKRTDFSLCLCACECRRCELVRHERTPNHPHRCAHIGPLISGDSCNTEA